jgi:hypothetical protein
MFMSPMLHLATVSRLTVAVQESRRCALCLQASFDEDHQVADRYDPTEHMSDFKRWVDSNDKSFDVADYIHAQMLHGTLTGDALMAVVLWVWPSFVDVDGFVVLSSRRDSVGSLVSQGVTGTEVEYWANHLNVDGVLPGLEISLSKHVGGILRDAWEAKLASQFPLLTFKVVLLDEECGPEVSVTFHQVS